jgi:hypothetical protein
MIAEEFRSIGLEPLASGNYFQEIPFIRVELDPRATITVDGSTLIPGRDFTIPVATSSRSVTGDYPVVFGGAVNDSTFVPAPGSLAGKMVLLIQPPPPAGARAGDGRGAGRGRGGRGAVAAAARFQGSAGFFILGADALSGRAGGAALGAPPAATATAPTPSITVSRSAAQLLLGAAPETLTPGASGKVARINIAVTSTNAPTRNVGAILRGSDPVLRDEWILIDAHYDHLGIGNPQNGDSIYNGADDDASGTVAVIEIARALAKSQPRRSIIFLATTGEERGLIGTNYFIANPFVPLDRIVANFEIEMIGRPDSLAGGSGRGWLTGYERSSMGESFTAAGLPVVADPRPSQSFYTRSDNIAFARRGIVAHVISSFNLHSDYHRASDDVDKVDFVHMTALINTSVKAVELLANGPRPTWKPGGQPGGGRGGE